VPKGEPSLSPYMPLTCGERGRVAGPWSAQFGAGAGLGWSWSDERLPVGGRKVRVVRSMLHHF
jgi:hypothetical protein